MKAAGQASAWLADLYAAGQFRHGTSPVYAAINQLLCLHIIGHLPLEVHPPLQVAGACKVLGAASYEADCQHAAVQSQGALLPEAMNEWDDPFVTAQGLPQWPAADLHRVTPIALVTKLIIELLAIMTTSVVRHAFYNEQGMDMCKNNKTVPTPCQVQAHIDHCCCLSCWLQEQDKSAPYMKDDS